MHRGAWEVGGAQRRRRDSLGQLAAVVPQAVQHAFEIEFVLPVVEAVHKAVLLGIYVEVVHQPQQLMRLQSGQACTA